MGSVMDQERPWERDTKPEGATLRERIKDVLRDKNRLHETVEQIICELERLEAMIATQPPASRATVSDTPIAALEALEASTALLETLAEDLPEDDVSGVMMRVMAQRNRAALEASHE